MVSSQVLQKTIDELRAITRIDLCVLSLEGQKVASTFSEEGFEPEHIPHSDHRQTVRYCRRIISLKYTMIRMWNMFW